MKSRLKMNIKNKLFLMAAAMVTLLIVVGVIIYVTGARVVTDNKVVIELMNFESQMKTYQKQHADWINALSNH